MRLAARRSTLEAHLETRLKDVEPGSCLVVVRSSEDERRLSRLLGPGVAVETLARFLGRSGPHGIEDEDLLPAPVLQWLVEKELPAGYKETARQHLATVFLDAIQLLEENAIRPPYPGTPRQEGEAHLEAAHRALVRGLEPHHEAGRFAAFERVSLAREGPSRIHVAYPALERVVFFGIDTLSTAERSAVENVLADTAVDVEWCVLGSLPGAGDHPALAFTRPLMDWLGERGEVHEMDQQMGDGDPRVEALRSLFSLKPGASQPLAHVALDAPKAGDGPDDPDASRPPRDRVDEVRRLMARVRSLIDQGVEPHRIGVVVPALQDYSDLLEDLFEEHGIPAGLSFRGTLRMGPVGSLLSAVLEVLDRGLARDPVLDVAAHSLCAWPVRLDDERTRTLNARFLRVRLQEAGANPRGLEGAGGWREAVEVLRRRETRELHKMRQRSAQDATPADPSPWFEAQMQGALDLVARLDALASTRDPERFLADLRGFLDHVGLRKRLMGAVRTAADPGWVLAGHEGIIELLQEVEDAFSLGQPSRSGVQQVREVIRRLLQSNEIKAWADPEEGVQVIAWRGARFARFEHVFVLGATQDALPERDEASAVEEVLGDRFGRNLVRLDRASEARRILHQLLADTSGRIVFSAPSLQQDAPLVRSVLLDELAERFELEPAGRAGSVATAREAARVSVLERRALAEPPPYLEVAWGLVAQRTHGVGDDSFAGRILDDRVRSLEGTRPVLSRAAVSASRLSGFAKCPFRSLVVDGLGLRAPWVRDEEMDPRDKGGILHDVLEGYIRAAIEQHGTPLRVVPGRRKEHEALLLEAALDVIEQRRRRSVGFRAYEESLLGGLPGASNPYSGDPKGLLVRFLDDLERFEENEGVLAVELDFRENGGEERDPDKTGSEEEDDHESASFPVETPAGRVRLRGRIDRLDQVVDEDGSVGLRVVEYKSGSVPDRELVAGGVEFQLPLYAWVAGLLFPGRKVQEAVYHQLKRPREKEAGIVEKVRFSRSGKNDLESLVKRTPGRVGQILTAQEAGRFPLTLLDEKEAGCDWCELRRGCGLRPEVTGLRREKARGQKAQGPAVSGYVPDRLDLANDERTDSGDEDDGDGRGSR